MLVVNNMTFTEHGLYLDEVSFCLCSVVEQNAYLERSKSIDMMKGAGTLHETKPFLFRSNGNHFVASGKIENEWNLDNRHSEQEITDFQEYIQDEYGSAYNVRFQRHGNVLRMKTDFTNCFDISDWSDFPMQEWSFRNEHAKLTIKPDSKLYCVVTSEGLQGPWKRDYREMQPHTTLTLEPKGQKTLYVLSETVVTSDSQVIPADTPTSVTSDLTITNHNDVGLRIVRVWKSDS